MWQEVARLAREDGVTVFLTTQYLEEADALADRIGIIDLGKIVAAGTPEELKAEIGRPTLEVVPAGATGATRWRPCSSASASRSPRRPAPPPCGSSTGPRTSGGRARARRRGPHARDFQLHAPTLDDVFLARTGRKLEGGEESGEHRDPAPVA